MGRLGRALPPPPLLVFEVSIARQISNNFTQHLYFHVISVGQRWSRGHKARGQGHKKNPRPRSRTAFPRTDTFKAKDRNAQGHGQGPRTQAQVLSKKNKKKVFTKIFQAISTKKRFLKNFSSAPQNFNK